MELKESQLVLSEEIRRYFSVSISLILISVFLWCVYRLLKFYKRRLHTVDIWAQAFCIIQVIIFLLYETVIQNENIQFLAIGLTTQVVGFFMYKMVKTVLDAINPKRRTALVRLLRIAYIGFLVGMNTVIVSGIATKCTECEFSGQVYDYTYKPVWIVQYIISLVINFINVWLYCVVIRQINKKASYNMQFMTEYEDPSKYKR